MPMLLKFGTNLQAQDKEGQCILHIAFKMQLVDLAMKAVGKCAACMVIKDSQEETYAFYASLYNLCFFPSSVIIHYVYLELE